MCNYGFHVHVGIHPTTQLYLDPTIIQKRCVKVRTFFSLFRFTTLKKTFVYINLNNNYVIIIADDVHT